MLSRLAHWCLFTRVGLYTSLLVVAVAAWAMAGVLDVSTEFRPRPPAAIDSIAGDAWFIARHNLAVAAFVLVGAVTLGGLSLLITGSTAVRIGVSLHSASISCPGAIGGVALYLPLELLALSLFATSSITLARDCCLLMARGQRFSIGSHLLGAGAATVVMVAAAFTEAVVRHLVIDFENGCV